MKKMILTVSAAFIAMLSFAQRATADKMMKYSGGLIDVTVIKAREQNIIYKYPGEDAEQTIGKFAVAKITCGKSGRIESISEKIAVSGKDDWESVEVLTDPAQVVGLKKREEMKGKASGFLSYNSAGSADKEATKRIKVDAADLDAPFILLVSDKSDGFGVKQAIKKGVVYYYK